MGQSRADRPTVKDGPREGQRSSARRSSAEDFPELDCLRNQLPLESLAAASRRAAFLDTGADQVLIAQGVIKEADYLKRFSLRSGIQLADFSAVTEADIDLTDDEVHLAAQSGYMSMRIGGRPVVVACLRDKRAREFEVHATTTPRGFRNLRLATEEAFSDLLGYRTDGIIGRAIYGLHRQYPALSAASTARFRWLRFVKCGAVSLSLLAVAFAAACLAPGPSGDLLALLFVAAIALRFMASLIPARRVPALTLSEAELPCYSVIVALYREAASVPQLLDALLALDYPAEKLDIILVVETDDLATRAAIARERPPSYVRVIVAPDRGPRTKPKALNFALPFARGEFVAVYDAEDIPDSDRLRIALAAFEHGGDDLACVQARLAVENSGDSFFTRMFAAEYAGQFDIMMPGYDRLGLPWPLGGTSNHFRAAVLRKVCAWDPFNVTEDADLGLRLARFRYRTATIRSTTWEEAPVERIAWLKQRTRWMKGWMQTWWIHARHPRRYWRRTGWRGMVARDLIIGGGLIAALAYPLVPIVAVVMAAEYVVTGQVFYTAGFFSPLHLASCFGGLAVSVIVQLRGLAYRGRLDHAGSLLWTPLYWLLLSAAAWRAVVQLHFAPHRWEKTEHGVAKAKVAPTDTASDRQPPLQARA